MLLLDSDGVKMMHGTLDTLVEMRIHVDSCVYVRLNRASVGLWKNAKAGFFSK
jgi:hypothetical protein